MVAQTFETKFFGARFENKRAKFSGEAGRSLSKMMYAAGRRKVSVLPDGSAGGEAGDWRRPD
jgi:hypothetical protein